MGAVGCLMAMTKAGGIKDPAAVKSQCHVRASDPKDDLNVVDIYRHPAGLAEDPIGWLHLKVARINVSLPKPPNNMTKPYVPPQEGFLWSARTQ